MATHSTVWTGILSGSTGSLAVGTCVLTDGTNYIPATTANRTTYGRTVGIAITAASTNNAAFEYQVAGLISNSITGLGAGATSWVRASATATLERCTPSGSDDVVGWCEANGDLHVCPGFLTAAIVNGGGGTPGGSSGQLQYNNAGAFGGIAGATTDGTTLTVKDADFVIADDVDATKKAQFQCSGLTTATTRTFTLPDASTTIVGTDVGQTLTSKTIDASFNTISNLTNGNISATAGIFGTKISPDFGAQNVVTTGYVQPDHVRWATVNPLAADGLMRIDAFTHDIIACRSATDAADKVALSTWSPDGVSINELWLGAGQVAITPFDRVVITANEFVRCLINGSTQVWKSNINGTVFNKSVICTNSAIGALDIDWTAGNVFTKTLAAGANAITFSNTQDGQTIIVRLTGASSTVDWTATGVKWAGGTAPTQTASGIDVYTFVRVGSDIFGSVVQNMS